MTSVLGKTNEWPRRITADKREIRDSPKLPSASFRFTQTVNPEPVNLEP